MLNNVPCMNLRLSTLAVKLLTLQMSRPQRETVSVKSEPYSARVNKYPGFTHLS